MAAIGGDGRFCSSIASHFSGPDKKCYNNVPALAAREYGYPYNLPQAHNQSVDYLIRARYRHATGMFSKDLYAHYGCINAIEFSNNGRLMVSGGDDRRVLLWNVEKALSSKDNPIVMQAEHTSNIFCLGLASDNRRIFSGGNDEQVIIHDVETREPLKVIPHREVVYCLSVDPQNDNLFATACDEGRVFMLDIRESCNLDNLPVLIRTRSAYHAVMHHPIEPRLIVTANSREGVSLWDIRKPRVDLIKYNGGLVTSQSAMSVRFNSSGTKIVALRRRLPAILYNTMSPHPIAEFDHKDYYNSCTMKSCCFGGSNDEYILSGSDDFRLYMWKIPDEIMENDYSSNGIKWIDHTHMVLRGHRSIVNQVRYNYSNSTIASSGVEKVIKVWSLFDIFDPSDKHELKNVANQDNRKVYSHEEYIQLVLESGHLAAHDYSNQSIQEDARMMAFFDSLVQRDIEGVTTDSNSDGDSDFPARYNVTTRNHARTDSVSDLSSSDEDSELLYICDDQIVNYIKSFSERMESSVNRLYGNGSVGQSVVPNDNNNGGDKNGAGTSNQMSDILCEPSTSFAAPSSVQANTSTASTSNISQAADRTNETENGGGGDNDIDTNKIAILINDKKKDQLRKVTRSAIRSTRIRLGKLQKYISREMVKTNENGCSTSSISRITLEDKEKLKKQLEDVLVILERLSKKIDIECKSNRGHFNRMMFRLRYLTNRSRWVSPDSPLGFDSDDDPPLIGGNDLLNEVRMAHRLANLADLLNVGNADPYVNGDDSDDDDDSCIVDRSLYSTDCDTDNGTKSSKSSISQIKSPDASSSSSDDSSSSTSSASSSSSSSSSRSSHSYASQIKSPDPDKSQIKSPDNSSSSSDEAELHHGKVKRHRRRAERKRAKMMTIEKTTIKSKEYINTSDEDSDSSSESSDTSSEPSKVIKLPRPLISYNDEDEDDGFEGDTESKKRLNSLIPFKSCAKRSTSSTSTDVTNCQPSTSQSTDNDDHQPMILQDQSNDNNPLTISSEIIPLNGNQNGGLSDLGENIKPNTSSSSSTFKSIDNTGKCFRKRKSDSTNESHIYKSVKRKND